MKQFKICIEVFQLLSKIHVSYDSLDMSENIREMMYKEIVKYKRRYGYKNYCIKMIPLIDEICFNDEDELIKNNKIYKLILKENDDIVLDPNDSYYDLL